MSAVETSCSLNVSKLVSYKGVLRHLCVLHRLDSHIIVLRSAVDCLLQLTLVAHLFLHHFKLIKVGVAHKLQNEV